MNEEIRGFIAAAKANGTSSEEVFGLLQARGWSPKEIREANIQVFESSSGIAIPSRQQRGESPALDGFLYGLSSMLLVSLVSHLLWITHMLIGARFDPPAGRYGGGPEMMIFPIAGIIVACPFYLLLMWINHRRFAKGITPRNSGVRNWVISATMLIGSIAILCYLMSGVFGLLRGENLMGAVLKSGVPILVLSAFIYYYYWLMKPAQEAS